MTKLNKENEMVEIGDTGIMIDKSIKEYLENQRDDGIDESCYKFLENETNYKILVKFLKKALKDVDGVRINE